MTIIKELPKLYKKTSTGAIQEWQVSVESDGNIAILISKFGQTGGKIQTSQEQVLEGKNAGKANATTPTEQALLQAESDWKGKLKKGYVGNIEDAQAGKIDGIIEGGIFPILAHKFSEQGHKIKYPALAQPKLDGHRCTSQLDLNSVQDIAGQDVYGVFGDVTLWSRTRKPILSVPHIVKALHDVVLELRG